MANTKDFENLRYDKLRVLRDALNEMVGQYSHEQLRQMMDLPSVQEMAKIQTEYEPSVKQEMTMSEQPRFFTQDDVNKITDTLKGMRDSNLKFKEQVRELDDKVAILQDEANQYKILAETKISEIKELQDIIDMQQQTIDSLMEQMNEITESIGEQEKYNDDSGVPDLGQVHVELRGPGV